MATNLLLLPPAPYPATYAAIKVAYHGPLVSSFQTIKLQGSSTLDIALPCPHLWNSSQKSQLYASTQDVVSSLYKLVAVVAAQLNIELSNIDGAEVIDVRVILVAYPRDGNLSEPLVSCAIGPVVDLGLLAQCGRPWKAVYSVETEQGEQLLRNFSSRTNGRSFPVKKLRGGLVQVSSTFESLEPMGECHSVAVGGTFDHLHIGHKLLLTMVAYSLDTSPELVITIGVTAAQLLEKKKYAEQLESWGTRMQKTWEFMKAIMIFSDSIESTEEVHNPGANGHAVLVNNSINGLLLQQRYVEIWDPFGPTITDPGIDTIVVSGETSSGGKMVNDKRKELGMSTLRVFEVDVLDAEEDGPGDFQAKLSSTEIRKAQATRSNLS
jgi:phosphopantetheine adenylyltransferase